MWKESDNFISKDFYFKDFTSAIDFINHVASIANTMNHHPIIINDYNCVTLKLTTMDAGKIVTEKDRIMAKQIDIIYNA